MIRREARSRSSFVIEHRAFLASNRKVFIEVDESVIVNRRPGERKRAVRGTACGLVEGANFEHDLPLGATLVAC